jgi:phosphoglycolate phosphatase
MNSSHAEVLTSTGPVLLDFDGPVTPLMPAPVNWQIAEAMRDIIWAAEAALPESIAISADPLVVLRLAYSRCVVANPRFAAQVADRGLVQTILRLTEVSLK